MNCATDDKQTKVFPIIDLPTTGENIRRLRLDAGLSVRELSRMLCLADVQAVYKWQRGETLPSLDNLVMLSQVFHVTIDEILVLTGTEHI